MKENKNIYLFNVLALLIIMAVTASCSGQDSSEQAQENAPQSELPVGFPETVPVYQPSSITTTSTNQSAANTTYIIGFMTDSSKEEVIDYYESQLAQNGWSVNPVSSETHFSAKKGDIYIIVSIIGAGSKAVFTITAPKLQND